MPTNYHHEQQNLTGKPGSHEKDPSVLIPSTVEPRTI